MEDLAQARAEALEKKRASEQQYRYHIQVGMGSCGIAVGAADTWQALQRLLASHNLTDIRLTQTGCIGLCALEPIVRVSAPDHPLVTYGRVTPEVARRIVQEHIKNQTIVMDHVVENV
jgi:(2Fe-2S) ferredoxin